MKRKVDVKVEKSATVSSGDIALFDANSRKLLSTYANPDHGSTKSAIETVKVRGEQTVLLDVTISPGVDNFKIKLDGAIKIAPSTPAESSATNGGVQSADPASQSQTGDGSTGGGSTNAAAPDASASGATTASQDASASQPTDTASAPQTGAAGSGLPGKAGKVNAKINSAGGVLNSIISGASSTADSVKSVKKKRNAHAPSSSKSNVTLAATNAKGNNAAQPTLLIDRFKVGPYSTPLTASGGTTIQHGDERELLGGSRSTYRAILNPDAQPVSLQVLTTKPALVVNAGYHAVPSLQLGYKVPRISADLLSKYDRFLIDFGGLDHGVDLYIGVYGADKKVDGHTGEGCKVLAPDGPFTLSFPFARFAAPEVLKQTNTIVFEFQATSWRLDYAITRISSGKGDPVGKQIVTCSK